MASSEDARVRVFRAATVIGQGYEIVEMLREFPDGASFSQILKQTGLNPNALTRKLWGLMEEGIVERNVVVPDEKRRYSFYKLTPEGELFVLKLEELQIKR